jgi:hypothetical protein
MNKVRDKHNQAMDYAEMALLARRRGKREEEEALSRCALQAELEAIEALLATERVEPTCSVLHRSAATLALDCGEPRTAEKLVAAALAGSPPEEIAEELRDLMEQIQFRRHLELRGITLGEDEMQMSLEGPSTGFGIVESSEFLHRVTHASKAIYRIVERRSRRPFREAGRLKKSVKDNYEVFVSVPRAASFAVTLKLGQPSDQPNLPHVLDNGQVIDEFMDLMQLVNHRELDELRRRIPDDAYLRNFVGLAKKIAPDGDNVRLVGFTSTRSGENRYLPITRCRSDFPGVPASLEAGSSGVVEVRGTLRFADDTRASNGTIRLVEEDGQTSHDVKVPAGMMDDIVRPMWGSIVVVKGVFEGRHIVLEDIMEG